jgi:hypothetical protein
MTLRVLTAGAVVLASVLALDAQEAADRRAQAPYVFVGTVMARGGAAADRAANPSLTVRVDDILLQKGTFEDQTGREVSMVGVTADLRPDSRHIFYTEPLSFGDSIVVSLVEAVEAGAAPASRQGEAARQEARQAFLRREIRERASAATLVVVGAVSRVSALPTPAAPESEHLPDFRLARVKVDRVLQGARTTGEVEFVFAASRDVQWFRAPKFTVGDRGVFLLKPAPGPEAERLRLAPQRLTLLDPLDFRTAAELPLVEAALKEPRQ